MFGFLHVNNTCLPCFRWFPLLAAPNKTVRHREKPGGLISPESELTSERQEALHVLAEVRSHDGGPIRKIPGPSCRRAEGSSVTRFAPGCDRDTSLGAWRVETNSQSFRGCKAKGQHVRNSRCGVVWRQSSNMVTCIGRERHQHFHPKGVSTGSLTRNHDPARSLC